tara:strand:+ start:1631 stop:3643 length:2013 start_codon:yes stop_codon:yes gene_type:complete
MPKMDDYKLNSIISSEITDALNHFDSEFSQERIRAMDFYLGEPFGNEVDGRSSVVSTEVADTVEAIMPNLMRVFTANDKYVRFSPRTAEDVERAEQVSDYVNYIINHDNEGYKIIYNWFKDALLFRLGVVKYFYEEEESVTEEEYNGLTEDELAVLLANPDIEVVEQQETVVNSYMEDDGTVVPLESSYDLSVRVTERKGKIKVINVPPEEFLVNRRATSLEDAHFVAHRTTMTVSDLVAMGYDREEVEAYAGTFDLDTDEERTNRFQDLEANTGTDAADPTLKEVVYYECVMKVDYDGDGIAERRRICAIGNEGTHILHNEPFDHVPFAVVSPILMPHRMIGRSIYDMTEDLQVIKSTLMRQYLDSVYTSTLPRIVAVEGQVNLDDLLEGTAGGIIRARQPGMVQPISGTPVGGEVRPLMDYLDNIKEQRTGMSKASQGLDANALQSTTASAISATVRGAQVKLESYARTMAETGVKSLFKGILHLVTKYDNKPRIVRLRNNFVPIDPREWTSEYDVVVQVGLGTADDEQKIAFLTQIAAKQEQILMQLGPSNPIVSMSQYVNTLRSIAEIGGFKDADMFFNNPQQIQMMQQQQQQQPPQPDPAVAMKQQQMEAELALKREKMQADIQLERERMTMEMELRRQELQAEAELRMAKAVTDSQISTNLPRV